MNRSSPFGTGIEIISFENYWTGEEFYKKILQNLPRTPFNPLSGEVVGLAPITPAAGMAELLAVLLIRWCEFFYSVVVAENKFGYDDKLDAVGIYEIRWPAYWR